MAADASTLSTSEHTDPLVPTYTDGTPITWDGNYAHIDGALYETGRYYRNKGLFQTLIRDRYAALSQAAVARAAHRRAVPRCQRASRLVLQRYIES